MLVEVWFFKGVRERPPYGSAYRPHFLIKNTEEYYFGVQFEDLKKAPFGEHLVAKVKLIYKDLGVDYSKFIPGIYFEIREGKRVVGEGVVLENSISRNSNWNSKSNRTASIYKESIRIETRNIYQVNVV